MIKEKLLNTESPLVPQIGEFIASIDLEKLSGEVNLNIDINLYRAYVIESYNCDSVDVPLGLEIVIPSTMLKLRPDKSLFGTNKITIEN